MGSSNPLMLGAIYAAVTARKLNHPESTWLIGSRFIVTIFYGKEKCSIVVDDKKNHFQSLDITPKLGESLGLFDEPVIKLSSSIDSCSIIVPKNKYNYIFKLIENYLLPLEKNSRN